MGLKPLEHVLSISVMWVIWVMVWCMTDAVIFCCSAFYQRSRSFNKLWKRLNFSLRFVDESL